VATDVARTPGNGNAGRAMARGNTARAIARERDDEAGIA